MNSNPPKKSNPVLCGIFISLGILCICGTVLAAFLLKDGIIGRVGEPPRVDALSDGFKIETINRRIEATEREIESEKKASPVDAEAERRKIEETFKKANPKVNVNLKPPFFDLNKSEKLKELEEKKRRLIAERDDLIGKSQAKSMKPPTWEEFFDDYSLDLFLPGVLPLGLFSLFLARFAFGGLPARNPLSLTGFERRSLLFFAFALVFSAFGFFLFVWILALVY